MRCIKCGDFASHKVKLTEDYKFKLRFYCGPCLKISKKGEFKQWDDVEIIELTSQ